MLIFFNAVFAQSLYSTTPPPPSYELLFHLYMHFPFVNCENKSCKRRKHPCYKLNTSFFVHTSSEKSNVLFCERVLYAVNAAVSSLIFLLSFFLSLLLPFTSTTTTAASAICKENIEACFKIAQCPIHPHSSFFFPPYFSTVN